MPSYLCELQYVRPRRPLERAVVLPNSSLAQRVLAEVDRAQPPGVVARPDIAAASRRSSPWLGNTSPGGAPAWIGESPQKKSAKMFPAKIFSADFPRTVRDGCIVMRQLNSSDNEDARRRI